MENRLCSPLLKVIQSFSCEHLLSVTLHAQCYPLCCQREDLSPSLKQVIQRIVLPRQLPVYLLLLPPAQSVQIRLRANE